MGNGYVDDLQYTKAGNNDEEQHPREVDKLLQQNNLCINQDKTIL